MIKIFAKNMSSLLINSDEAEITERFQEFSSNQGK